MSISLSRIANVPDIVGATFDLLITSSSSSMRNQFFRNKRDFQVSESWIVSESGIVSEFHASALPGSEAFLDATSSSNSYSVNLLDSILASWIDNSKSLHPRIFVDISCMSRRSMSNIVTALCRIAARREVSFHVGYVIAAFSPPPSMLPPNRDIRPISPFFAGWPSETAASTSLVIGLGYEKHKAEGASEYFDASETWVFMPQSPVSDYNGHVCENNADLIGSATRNRRFVAYPVLDPARTFGVLASLTSDLIDRTNPVILPLGPKIFFMLSLLVAALYEESGVWEISTDCAPDPRDEHASEQAAIFEVVIRPR